MLPCFFLHLVYIFGQLSNFLAFSFQLLLMTIDCLIQLLTLVILKPIQSFTITLFKIKYLFLILLLQRTGLHIEWIFLFLNILGQCFVKLRQLLLEIAKFFLKLLRLSQINISELIKLLFVLPLEFLQIILIFQFVFGFDFLFHDFYILVEGAKLLLF